MDVAWSLDPTLTPRFDPADAVAITPGGGRLGGLYGGALDSRLIEHAAAKPTEARILEVDLNAIEADALGLVPGSVIRVFTAPADALPEGVWGHLLERQPIGLRAAMDDGRLSAIELVSDVSESTVTFADGTVTTTWSPTPTLVVMGPGPIAAALAQAAQFMGWKIEHTPNAEAGVALATSLSSIDSIVVIGHDVEGTGRVLQAALGSQAGYIGSIGPEALQVARGDWLAYRGITDTSRVIGPAGIEIGAKRPEEVAIAVVAQIVAVRNAAVA